MKGPRTQKRVPGLIKNTSHELSVRVVARQMRHRSAFAALVMMTDLRGLLGSPAFVVRSEKRILAMNTPVHRLRIEFQDNGFWEFLSFHEFYLRPRTFSGCHVRTNPVGRCSFLVKRDETFLTRKG